MGLMRKLTSAIVASSLVFGLVGSAFADFTPEAAGQAAANMQGLKIVEGRGDGDLALNATITRAELVTIIVRAYGHKDTAALLQGVPSFSDVAGTHWASGNVAMAKRIIEANGHALGLPDGTFNPEGQVTAAEAVAFLLKFLGVEFNASTTSWPDGYIQVAVDAGVITAGDQAYFAASLNAPATRGVVFYMADSAFRGYNIGGGKTVYTTYLDPIAPTLTVDAVEATTLAAKVTVSGSVNADAKSVFVNGAAATITDGKFSAEVELTVGANEISVIAMDLAGNKAPYTTTVTRNVGDAASIEAAAITVAAGASVDLGATVKDAAGNTLADAAVAGESTLGTVADGKFAAGTAAGTGTVTLTSGDATVNVEVTVTAGQLAKVATSASSVAAGTKVTLTGQDEYGNVVSGVTFTQTSADALIDSTQGVFIASKPGTYTVTAKAGDVTKDVTIGVYDNTAVGSYQVTLGAANLIANKASTTTLTIQALDKNGNAIVDSSVATIPVISTLGLQYSTNGGDSWAGYLNTTTSNLTAKNGKVTLTVRTEGSVGGQTAVITAGSGSTASRANLAFVDQVATSVSVGNGATYLASNDASTSRSTFSVRVMDQDGKPMMSGYYPVKLDLNAGVDAYFSGYATSSVTAGVRSEGSLTATSGNPATLTVYYSGNDYAASASYPVVKVAPKYNGATGAVTVSATAAALTSGTKSVTMQMAGQPAKVAMSAASTNVATPKAGTLADTTGTTPVVGGESVSYTISATDAVGVPVTSTEAVYIEFPGLTAAQRDQIRVTIGATVAKPTGTAGRVSAAVGDSFSIATGKYTGALNFVVKSQSTAAGALAATAQQTVTFKANAVNSFSYKVNGVTTSHIEVAPNTETTVVVSLIDAAGNAATNAASKITLTSTGSAGGNNNDVVINGSAGAHAADVAADGTATFVLKTGSFVGASYSLAFTGTYTNSSGGTSDFTVLPAALVTDVKNTVATSVSVALFADNTYTTPVSTIDAGATFYGAVTVTDAAGRRITTETVQVKPINSDGTLGTAVAANFDSASNTYRFSTTAAKAPASSFKVYTTKSVTAGEAQFAIGVRPGTSVGGVDITGDATQAITKNTEKAVTVQLTDANGNAVINSTNSNQAVVVSFGSLGLNKVAQVRAVSNGLAVSDLTVYVAPGASSVTFYVVTDENVGEQITMTASATVNASTYTETINLNVQ